MKKFLCALTFLTRLPLPNRNDFTIDDYSGSIYFYPLVGLIIGGLLALAWYLCQMILPPIPTAALLVLVHLLLTGGLHLDGLMDTLDGVGGGRDREQRLAIMKDSRVGSFGAQGAAMILILKFSLYTQMNWRLLLLLVLAPVLAREVLIWAQVFYPYAREKGLGSFFGIQGDYSKFMVTTGITMALSVILLQYTGIMLLILTAVFIMILSSSLSRLLGGLTGDCYGALCELTEVFVFLAGLIITATKLII